MHTKSCICGSGILSRVNLKKTEDYIHGSISIRTSELNIVSFNVFQKQITRNNKENYSYKKMLDVMSNYKDETTGNPDFVCIPQNSEYPNASIRFKFDEHFKNLRLIEKSSLNNNKIIFKIYGLMVNSYDNYSISCTSIDYEGKLSNVEIANNGSKFDIGEVYDFTGFFREGIEGGEPVDNLIMSNFRLSELDIDFSKGFRVGEQSPF